MTKLDQQIGGCSVLGSDCNIKTVQFTCGSGSMACLFCDFDSEIIGLLVRAQLKEFKSSIKAPLPVSPV